ncbi:hypothetical protein QFC19_005475 [Naganishia cerealis]|uniref:Uncharacterized protein n=1 Tax=Naganishia cerealis TaxID=610337 RepID=A0ACC2VQ22_9TREE|nr:hypothetical protein QFC19_005475 [Naganishia cerealis]
MTSGNTEDNSTKRSIEQVEAEDGSAKAETRTNEVDEKHENVVEEQRESQAEGHDSTPALKRRKTNTQDSGDGKQGSGRSTRNSKVKPSSHEPKKIVQFLLSDKAIDMLDQLDSENEGDFHFPKDRLNPFQDLIAACMVSKPFSHRVATRAINDLFSKENSLTSPQEVLDFGHDKMQTLHKDKTTVQILGIAQVCQSTFGGSASLSGAREKASHDPAKERDLLVKSFKGYGPKTVDIFFRRVQVDWQEVYPFADAATIKAARAIGLDVDGAEGLRKVVDEAIEETDGEKKRLAFAKVVDVLVYLGLEKKTDQVEKQIGTTRKCDHLV